MTKQAEREIHAWCPYCRVPIPVLTVTVEMSGFWRRRCDVLVNGDASDYAAHMWVHQEQARAER